MGRKGQKDNDFLYVLSLIASQFNKNNIPKTLRDFSVRSRVVNDLPN